MGDRTHAGSLVAGSSYGNINVKSLTSFLNWKSGNRVKGDYPLNPSGRVNVRNGDPGQIPSESDHNGIERSRLTGSRRQGIRQRASSKFSESAREHFATCRGKT